MSRDPAPQGRIFVYAIVDEENPNQHTNHLLKPGEWCYVLDEREDPRWESRKYSPFKRFDDIYVALDRAKDEVGIDRWVIVCEDGNVERAFMSFRDSDFVDVSDILNYHDSRSMMTWLDIARQWDELFPRENPSKAIKWSKGPGSTGHWLGYVDGVGQDVAGLFLREASWRILRTPKGWTLHDWDGTGWHFSYAGETLAEVKRVAEQRQGEARENPVEVPRATIRVYTVYETQGEPLRFGLQDIFSQDDLEQALVFAQSKRDIAHAMVIQEVRFGRTFISFRDSDFKDVSRILGTPIDPDTPGLPLGLSSTWGPLMICRGWDIWFPDTRENPARLSDVSLDTIDAHTVDNLFSDMNGIAVYRDVFSEDEIKAFIEYCHMALSSVPEEDQWRIRTSWVRDQDNPRGATRRADAMAYGRPRAIVLALEDGRLSVRTMAHIAARELSTAIPRPLPQIVRAPNGTVVDLAYVTYPVPAYMNDEPDRMYARANLVLPNHDDIVATNDWVYTPRFVDPMGTPRPSGRYTFVGARHPGEEE